jgi:chemotaxis protein MotB
MAAIGRRYRRTLDIWPGYVDALANLLQVIIFLLMVFVIAQFFLHEVLSGRNAALRQLEGQVADLADMLALERKTAGDLKLTVERLSSELQASLAEGQRLHAEVAALSARATRAEQRLEDLSGAFQESFGAAPEPDAISEKARQLLALRNEVAALQALKTGLEREAAALAAKSEESERGLIEERKVSESARAQLALLNQQVAALRQQIVELTQLLDAAEVKAADQQAQITALGQRLNAALASKVQELSRYRSEFFGRLREVLGDQPDIRIVGDRFVFQSEVLFARGSADLGEEGRVQLQKVAETLKEIARRIPPDIDWVLQVEGHTDRLPINTPQFPSNWELSTARAISVVRLFLERGLPPHRLSAAGFGEFQPLDGRDDEIAFRRNRRIEIKLTQP